MSWSTSRLPFWVASLVFWVAPPTRFERRNSGEGWPRLSRVVVARWDEASGAFARVLARYVRELGVITLEDAVMKMTSMPARWLGQTDLGVIEVGMLADVAVFDPDVIQDMATYTEPHQYSVGIEHLLVSGVPVIRGGAMTGEKPGRWIQGPARRPIS